MDTKTIDLLVLEEPHLRKNLLSLALSSSEEERENDAPGDFAICNRHD
jgi:hypothetical protein